MEDPKFDAASIDSPECATELLNERPKWRHLFSFTTKQHIHYLGGALLTSAGTAALRTGLAVILGKVFDIVTSLGNGQISGSKALLRVSWYCILLASLGVAQWIINSAFLALWIIFGELQATNIRQSLFSGLMKMEQAWADSLPHGTTGLVASIQRKTYELQIATSQVFGYLAADFLTAIASLVIAFYTSWKLTLVLLATLPVSLVLLALTSRKIQPAITEQASSLDSASKILAASLSGIDLVKICNGYTQEVQSYMAHIDRAGKQYRLQARYSSIQIGYTSFWAVAMFVVGFWYGLVLVQQGKSPGHILTTFYAVLATLQGFESLLPNWLIFEKGMSAGQVLQALQSEVTKGSNDGADAVRPGYFVGAIDLKEISFSYPTAPAVRSLKNCSLSIPAGEFTFLVGRSGSGKSTIAGLISRTYETAPNSIYVDGIPIEKLQKQWLQQHIMLLEQSPVIFNDTLFRNIVSGHRDAASVTYHEVHQTCRKFGLESIIATLAGGLHAMIGGKGCPLSGGQRQRIALARAYLRDPPVLILDEPTSALDQHSRKMIMNEIREWRREKTTIIISHDLDSIRFDDFVYVLDNGTVSKSGFKRNLESADLGEFLTEALNEAIKDSASHIEINVIPPIAEDIAQNFKSPRRRHSPTHAQSWLMSRSNSSRYSGISLLSPRLSVLSSPSRVAGINDTLSPTAALCSGALSPPSRTTVQQRSPDLGRLSSSINRQFRATPWKTSLDLNARELQSPPLKPGLDLESLSSVSETSRFIKESNHRIVNLGRSTKKRKCFEVKSFTSILRTVTPVLTMLDITCLVLGIVTTMIGALTTPAFSYCLANLLAVMWSAGDKSAEGKQWALYLIIIAAVDGVCTGFGRYLLETSAQAWADATRHSALESILHQPKSWFIGEKNSHTRVLEALNVHAEEMRNLVGRFVPIIVSVATMVSVSVVWACIICWNLSLVALAPLPLVVLALKAYTVLGNRWETKCANRIEQTSMILSEVLAFRRTIANYGLENHFSSKFTQSVARCLGLGFRKALYTCPLFGLYQAFSYALTSLMFYHGTSLLARDNSIVSADTVLQVMNLLLFSIGTATELLSTMPQITTTTASASRVIAYTELSGGEITPEIESQSDGRASLLPIRMRNLSFSYPGVGVGTGSSSTTLANVNLDIMPGRCTVLVGASGCGKSTLLSLVLGLHRPPHPHALSYADTPSAMMNPRQLRAAVGYVPQTPFLFPGTLADNIAYGLAPDSPLRHLANVREAARDAGIDDFIMSLPDGYRTIVGDGGATSLSGGQAQRVTIARALVRRPLLLVMDEPTSALDQESAATVRACVAELVARWRTERRQAAVVMATHNVEMMRVADTIVVMENGRNVEQGAFEDLWFNGDAFRRLVRQNEEA
ncbi:hypothetical protein PWT90_02533 [Aphanocladium album]|nr:hypothetical protein PWT90_02533 [Aphanocladium album]